MADWSLLNWTALLPGTALWALAFYVPLSAPLSRLEDALAEGGLSEAGQQAVLVVASLALAIGIVFLVVVVVVSAGGDGDCWW